MSRRRRSALIAAVLLAVTAASAIACGPAAPPPVATRKETVARWPDVFEGTPDIYGVVRPQALKRDGLYGSFWTSLMRVASARGFTRGTTMVETAEGADEIIVGINKGDDAAIVLRGVPASIEPQKVADAEGHPLFRAVNDRAKVAEYEIVETRKQSPGAGALFVLPDRTWVGALGEARSRARQAFATPLNRPTPRVDADALVAVRFAGPVTHLFDRHPVWGVLTKKLVSATFTLKPAKGGLVISLAYEEADVVARAEMHAKGIVEDLAKDKERFGWLKDADVRYEGNAVLIRVAIPPRLLEELPNASGRDFGL